jgi:hypothetical protein
VEKVYTTPLIGKLGIKAGQRVAFPNAPADFAKTLGALPPGCTLVAEHDEDETELDVIVYFGGSLKTMQNAFASLKKRLAPNGGLWLCWPKKASKVQTDLSDSVVQRVGLDGGLVDNKVCSIDATWSAARFVFRLKDRPGQ